MRGTARQCPMTSDCALGNTAASADGAAFSTISARAAAQRLLAAEPPTKRQRSKDGAAAVRKGGASVSGGDSEGFKRALRNLATLWSSRGRAGQVRCDCSGKSGKPCSLT